MRVALLPARSMVDRLFSPADLEELAGIAEVVRHDSEETSAAVVTAIAGEAEAVVTSWGCPRLDADLLGRLPELRLVVHAAGSVKPVVSPALWERGIRVSSANGPLGRGVAETALGMTIASLKNLWRLAEDIAGGGWDGQKTGVRELYGTTVGVIGAGKAGRHYIDLLRAFDAEILLSDPTLTAEQATLLGATLVPLDDLMARSDVISIHAPAIPATHHLVNAERLRRMKDGAILINTARGSIIDESALVEELTAGRLFACLDVTDPEPPARDHPFRTLPNCVLTGHVAGAVNNGLHRVGRYAVAEIRRYLAGERLDGEQEEAALASVA